MSSHEQVIAFISHFNKFVGVTEAFTQGCCFHFTTILLSVFGYPDDSRIMYNDIDGHFATLINGRLYDITGEISSDGFVDWLRFCCKEPNRSLMIIDQCKYFN